MNWISKDIKNDNSTFGDYVQINEKCELLNTKIGDYTYCNGYNQIANAEIGKFVSIAWGVRINPPNHPSYDRVAQHHFTYRSKQFGFSDTDDDSIFEWRKQNAVFIGNDVWIGHNALIMPGVTIGDGAVIGAGAIVTKNVEPYSVMVGVPARKIKMRFNPEQIEKIKNSKWWDWSHEQIKERLQDFKDIDLFIKKWC